jgi:serine/threonine-protein kinase RsbT
MTEPRAHDVFCVPIRDESDVAAARFRTRARCEELGFDARGIEAIALAVSEVARNVIVHGQGGELLIGTLRDGELSGVVVVAKDNGPGIPNLDDALSDGFSTGTGLGLGLSSARRLIDELELRTTIGEGTTVTLRQWQRPRD